MATENNRDSPAIFSQGQAPGGTIVPLATTFITNPMITHTNARAIRTLGNGFIFTSFFLRLFYTHHRCALRSPDVKSPRSQ